MRYTMARKKDRLRAAAILAVLLEEAEGQALQSSKAEMEGGLVSRS